MASGAEIIGTAFYYAFGYHTVEVYLAELDPAKMVIAPGAKIFDPLIGEKRELTRLDIDRVLGAAARRANGRYRVLVSRFADRQAARQLPLLRHASRRSERHRRARTSARAARGARVRRLAQSRRLARHEQPRLAETEGGTEYVRHYMFDFGSIIGSGTVFAQRHRAGNEYIFEAEARLADARDARPVHAAVAAYRLSRRAAVGRPVRRRLVRSGEMEARVSEHRVRQHARRRCVLGGADCGEVHAGDDSRRRRQGEVQRSAGDRVLHRRDAQAPEEGVATWLAGVNPLVDFIIEAGGDPRLAMRPSRRVSPRPRRRTRCSGRGSDERDGTDHSQSAGQRRTPSRGCESPPRQRRCAPAITSKRGVWRRTPPFLRAPRATPVTVHFRRTPAAGKRSASREGNSVRSYDPADRDAPTLVLAHGAGASHDSPWMKKVTQGLANRGVRVVTFDFPLQSAEEERPRQTGGARGGVRCGLARGARGRGARRTPAARVVCRRQIDGRADLVAGGGAVGFRSREPQG